MKPRIIFLLLSIVFPFAIYPQDFSPVKFGDMDHWVTRHINESKIIGGNCKILYEIGPDTIIDGNITYSNMGNSPWGTSNVMAKVAGITKTNTSVFKEKRGNGFCARLETRIESVKVLGIVNITVLASGSIFLGDMEEPITGTKGAERNLNWGVPFTLCPKAIRYDYKTKIIENENRIRLTGFSKKSQITGQDCAMMVLILQKRAENSDGKIKATRIGTVVIKYDKTTPSWVNGATYKILYGDISKHPSYDETIMGLNSNMYARNSRGENVKVEELGWGKPNETPTHMILQFSSSHGGAFIGSPGNTLWIDNVGLLY
ncbi:PCMD domain-containing protein [Parabacteroides goldsteinii]|uniref:PCMD domain-containing protein n=1 Tax=Parabacteroides goldsteinii TaxID=328812 RepID=UPI0021654B05|nr:PCMD domain-containing protein [Parabacteroides goldsteinii]MCS2427303.1 PCMD domain-containing protein [Parabacteroides goldsteinii]